MRSKRVELDLLDSEITISFGSRLKESMSDHLRPFVEDQWLKRSGCPEEWIEQDKTALSAAVIKRAVFEMQRDAENHMQKYVGKALAKVKDEYAYRMNGSQTKKGRSSSPSSSRAVKSRRS